MLKVGGHVEDERHDDALEAHEDGLDVDAEIEVVDECNACCCWCSSCDQSR